jgi:PTS system glucose-specific IIA component
VTLAVMAPCPGRLVPMAETPDPVFAGEMMGPGVTIDPDPGEVTVVSPIAGKVMVMHPHAFVVMGDDGVGILVHLGINTVRLKGKGFEVLTAKGATVETGDPMVRWDPSTITEDGMSPMVPVVAMERPKGSVPPPADGAVAVTGEVLFTVTP